MTEPPKGLSAQEQGAFAKQLADREIAATQPAPNIPTAVLTGGQPGAGKSNVKAQVVADFASDGGIVEIDPDDVRPQLPYMRPLIAVGAEEIPPFANVDAGTIAYQMIGHATAARRNILIDGTLKNPALASDLAGKLHAEGYVVELHGMAVYPGLSHARTYARRETEMARSATGFGRKVDDHYHDEAVGGFAQTLAAFHDGKQVDRIALYDAEGSLLYDGRLHGADHWTPVAPAPTEVLQEAHTQPTQATLQQTVHTWNLAANAMKERRADTAELAAIEKHLVKAVLQLQRARLSASQASDRPGDLTADSASRNGSKQRP